jgi:hypothetical protein
LATKFNGGYTAEALKKLAGCSWIYGYAEGSYRREQWRDRVSTYLKAWICELDPRVLSDMSVVLSDLGYKDYARKALEVALLSPRPSEIFPFIGEAREALEQPSGFRVARWKAKHVGGSNYDNPGEDEHASEPSKDPKRSSGREQYYWNVPGCDPE